MNTLLKQKIQRSTRRKRRIFYATRPKTARMRMTFVRTNRYFSVQIIDDIQKQTLCSASTNEKDFSSASTKNKVAARKLGELIAQRAKAKKIEKVYLDRRGHLYHGCLAEFSTAARENGLQF